MNKFTKFVKKNKSTILTCTGVAAFGGCIIFTYKNSPEMHEIHKKYKELAKKTKDKKEKRKLVVEEIKEQAPKAAGTIIFGAVGAGAIAAGHVIDLKDISTAGLALDRVTHEYIKHKDAVDNIISDDQKKEVVNKLVKDGIDDEYITEHDYDDHPGLYPCVDSFSGRVGWIKNIDQIERAILKTSSYCNNSGNDEASVNDLYDNIGCPEFTYISIGNKHGWYADDLRYGTGTIPVKVSTTMFNEKPAFYLDIDSRGLRRL